MINKKYFIIFLLHFFISFRCYGFGDEIRIYFFDVGQGNCTLIKRPKAPPILVDAGSSTNSVNTTSSNQKPKIIQQIINSIPQHNLNFDHDLQVIITHPDKDHINWIQDITARKNYKNGNGLKIKFLLGGAAEDYTSGEAKALLEYIKNNQNYKQTFVSPFKAEDQHLIEKDSFKLFPLNLIDSSSDSNTDSIVLKVTYGTLSATLTGDATGATTSHILAMSKWKDYMKQGLPDVDLKNFNNILGIKDLEANILQASHHGSETEGSNSETWFKTTNPEFLICSAGLNKGFGHPNYQILKRSYLLNPSRLKTDAPLHKFHCGKTPEGKQDDDLGNDRFKFLDGGEKGYKVMNTRYGFYNTTNSGTIVFKWKKDDTVLAFPTVEK